MAASSRRRSAEPALWAAVPLRSRRCAPLSPRLAGAADPTIVGQLHAAARSRTALSHRTACASCAIMAARPTSIRRTPLDDPWDGRSAADSDRRRATALSLKSRIVFMECPANGGMGRAAQMHGVQFTHGMVHCCEWTGVKLSVVMNEVGVRGSELDAGRGRRRRRDDAQHPNVKRLTTRCSRGRRTASGCAPKTAIRFA